MKPNFLVDKGNIKHKSSIFTKKNTMGQCAGRCLESLALVRGYSFLKMLAISP